MWPLSFITEEALTQHVEETIAHYGDKLKSFDIARFNSNIVDPIKLIFDKSIYQISWEDIIRSEIFRQRDKSVTNAIGYFHQRIFQYIQGCSVPKAGWDVIYTDQNGITIPEGGVVRKIYAEVKNKHNTMNSSSSAKTYIKMQNQVLSDDDCACFLVEAIAKKSQNIKWSTTVDGNKVGHKLIRRVSIDQFYALITNEDDAFHQLCMILPETIERVLKNKANTVIPDDTVFEELSAIAQEKNISIAIAIYLLGFSDYIGFKQD